MHRYDFQAASEQRVASMVTQQVVTALGGGTSSVSPSGVSLLPRTPGQKAGLDRPTSVDELLSPRRLPAIDENSARMAALEGKVDKLTNEIGDIKALLEELVDKG